MSTRLTQEAWATHHDNPPRRRHVCSGSCNEQAELIPLTLLDKLFPDLTHLLDNQQTGHTLHDNETGA